MDRGAWWATVHGVTKSRSRLKQLSMHTRIALMIPPQELYVRIYLSSAGTKGRACRME